MTFAIIIVTFAPKPPRAGREVLLKQFGHVWRWLADGAMARGGGGVRRPVPDIPVGPDFSMCHFNCFCLWQTPDTGTVVTAASARPIHGHIVRPKRLHSTSFIACRHWREHLGDAT